MENIVLVITVLICLWTDLKERRIYNKVLIPAFALGVGLNIWSNGFMGLKNSGFGFVLGMLFLIVPFIYGGIGGGDVKLLATVGAIKGPLFTFYTFLYMGVAGGVIAIIILIYRGKMVKSLKSIYLGLKLMFLSRFKIISFNGENENYMFPYGIAISIGTLIAFSIMGG